MGTTSNYSWPIPEDSDLVKDGAEAIRDLGNAIDTSAADFGGGLVHIETLVANAVSSINSGDSTTPVFSSDYEQYLIIFNVNAAAGNPVLNMRLRNDTTDATGADYNRQNLNINNTTVTANRSTTQTSFAIATLSTGRVGGQILVTNPFGATTLTTLQSTSSLDYFQSDYRSHRHDVAASYDGVSFFPGSSTITGTFLIYGLRQ